MTTCSPSVSYSHLYVCISYNNADMFERERGREGGRESTHITLSENCITLPNLKTPPSTQQFTVVPMVSLLQRFHCTGQFTVVPMVSLLQRFHCTGQFTVVPMVSLLQRFHCTGQFTVVPMVSLLQRVHWTQINLSSTAPADYSTLALLWSHPSTHSPSSFCDI